MIADMGHGLEFDEDLRPAELTMELPGLNLETGGPSNSAVGKPGDKYLVDSAPRGKPIEKIMLHELTLTSRSEHLKLNDDFCSF